MADTAALERALAQERARASAWEHRCKKNRDSLDFWRGRATRLEEELRAARTATTRKDIP